MKYPLRILFLDVARSTEDEKGKEVRTTNQIREGYLELMVYLEQNAKDLGENRKAYYSKNYGLRSCLVESTLYNQQNGILHIIRIAGEEEFARTLYLDLRNKFAYLFSSECNKGVRKEETLKFGIFEKLPWEHDSVDELSDIIKHQRKI